MFTNLRATFTAAAGPHWIRTGVVTGTSVYAFVTGVEGLMAKHGFPIEPNPPKLFFTVGALGLLIIFWFWKYAHDLRLAAQPKFDVSFNKDGLGIAEAIVKDQSFAPTAGGGAMQLQMFNPRLANYVRFRIDATSAVNVGGCSAAITGFYKRLPRQDAFTEIGLPQIIAIAPDPFLVRVGMPHRMDFLTVIEEENVLRNTSNVQWPLILEDELNEPATFRFVVAVNAENVTKKIGIEVKWGGKWDDLKGRQIEVPQD